MKLRPYQERLLKEVKGALNRNNRVLLYALCGCGKTIIALTLIRELIKQGKRVAVSCYSMKDIRKQWRNEIKNNFPDLWEELQIVCSTQDIPDYISQGIPAVSNGNVSKTKLLTIFIPQSIKDADMGKFDMIIIDEAHERLEVERSDGKMGQLKTIIKNHSKSNTKYLGLTGTGYELMRKGKFFEKGTSIIYDLVEGLTDGAINNCALRGEYFDFRLPNSCYKPDNELNSSGIKKFKKFFKTLNKHGKNLLKHKSFATAKLEKLISEIKGKTLVVIPPGTGYEEAIANFICVIKGPMAAVVNVSKMGDLCEKSEALFRSRESKTDFMVIIAKCSTGWDFPGLYNVIDLTFTRNPTSMIQRLARTVRPEPGKPTSQYIYCTDQTRSKKRVIYDLTYALRLTTESGIIACKGGEVDARIPEIMLKKMCRKSGEKKESIEPISFDDYISCTRHTLILKSLEQIKREEKESPWARLWIPVLREIHRQDKPGPWPLTEKFRHLIQEFFFEKKQSIESVLEKMRNKFPKIYNNVFENKSVKLVIQEHDLC